MRAGTGCGVVEAAYGQKVDPRSLLFILFGTGFALTALLPFAVSVAGRRGSRGSLGLVDLDYRGRL